MGGCSQSFGQKCPGRPFLLARGGYFFGFVMFTVPKMTTAKRLSSEISTEIISMVSPPIGGTTCRLPDSLIIGQAELFGNSSAFLCLLLAAMRKCVLNRSSFYKEEPRKHL